MVPSSQTVVYGQRPVFQWAGAAARGVAVELCGDRACERVERALRPTGRCALSDADLAEGPHFWRVRAEGVAPSPVWSFTVARAAAPAH